MKVSLNWIKDYVKIPKILKSSQIAYDLTMSTVEVENTMKLNEKFNNIVIGVIIEVISHPNADRLKICKTDIGNGEICEIVCGGSNLKKNMKVAVARPGAMVRWHGENNFVEIKNTKVRGVNSFGMICASSEIELFDLFPFTKEATIINLSKFDSKAGTPLSEALELDDTILEIDNKSLTNRPDLWGHYGIAREIATLYDLPLVNFKKFMPPKSATNLTVTVKNLLECPRYIGVKIEGLSIKPSPFEIQSRIWRVGVRPVNAIVDITNYVMLATGQPTHAFDFDNIKGHITVRHAFKKEKLLLLNGRELSLSEDNLIIADDESPIGLAGIMGSEKDSVLPKTNKVILEIANFNAISIRRTSTQHKIHTEAATRYEKAIDPERGDIALSLAMQLFKNSYKDIKLTSFCDNYPKHLKKNKIDVSLNWLKKQLGKHIPNKDMTNKLKRLGFEVNFNNDNMQVVTPTWRSTGDISIPSDIVEEIVRIHGLENFEATPITTTFQHATNQINIDIERKIKEYLAFRCKMREIFTYPWMDDNYIKAILQENSKKNMLSLSSPPSPSESYLCSSLLPNLCKAITNNLRFFNEFAIFESAQIFLNKVLKSCYDSQEKLPVQHRNIAGAYVGAPEKMNLLFRTLKGVIEALPYYVHVKQIIFKKNNKPIWADNVAWLNIFHNKEQIGNLALLSKKASLDCAIKKNTVALFELDIDLLKPYSSRTNKFSHILEYPTVDYDLSLLFDLSVKWDEISAVIKDEAYSNKLLHKILFIDEYKGSQVPIKKKSITFRLIIGSPEKTLTSNEIENYANSVVKRLNKTLGAKLRN